MTYEIVIISFVLLYQIFILCYMDTSKGSNLATALWKGLPICIIVGVGFLLLEKLGYVMKI